ncbi:hypothetical protein [Gynuella sp.]|uniref:hypothetical protein n=1 Tax=Gynuella sp. TaxID=2969146 RepID=UPI003D0F4F93
MKKILFIYLCFFALFSYAEQANIKKYKSLTNANLDWYKSNVLDVKNLLLNRKCSEAVPFVNTLGEIWQFRDGAIGTEISPMIAQSFISCPHLTFLWFDKHPKAFDDWVASLPTTLLTDYDGSYTDELSILKKELLVSLKSYLKLNNYENIELLAHDLVNKLETTEVRVVD